MPFLTIFTAPKPFTNLHINIIQRNAIRSWLQLDDVKILLIGEEAGMSEVATEYGIEHLPNVARNAWGTPLVSSIFNLAQNHSNSPLLCYINADILVMPDLVAAVRSLHTQVADFLAIGKRWDLDVMEPLDFPDNWVELLRERAFSEGRLHPPAGSDYFIYPRHLFKEMPPFAIGRAGWDNWMIYHARKQGWATIDATPEIMIVHQNHSYAHLPGGKPHYDQEESHINVKLARGPENNYTGYMVLDTNREFRNGRIAAPQFSLVRLIRRIEIAIMPKEKTGPRWTITRWLRRTRRRLYGGK